MKISLELFKNGLGTLSGLSWTPLGTLWGGVLGPLGRFGAALGRPSGAQELILGSERPPRGPQEGPKGGEKESKVILCLPSGFQDAPRGPKWPPRPPEMVPKRPPRGSQEGAKTFLSVSSEVMKKRSKFVSKFYSFSF